MLRIWAESPEGQASENLETDMERLEYTRKRTKERTPHQGANSMFYEDQTAKKRYIIGIASLEEKALKKLLRDVGFHWSRDESE
jgi:Ribonuclease G/E